MVNSPRHTATGSEVWPEPPGLLGGGPPFLGTASLASWAGTSPGPWGPEGPTVLQ